MTAPRFVTRNEWLAGCKGVQTASGDAGVWRSQSFAKLVPSEVLGTDIHWPGGNGNFASANKDPFAYFQKMQIGYRNQHEFDLGYSFGIPPNGWVFEIRGMPYRPASQDEPGNDIDENGQAPSILLACDLDGKVTDAQVTSARWVIDWVRDVYPKGTWIKGHREHGGNKTECPGDVLIARIHAGDFEPQLEDIMTEADVQKMIDDAVTRTVAGVWAHIIDYGDGKTKAAAEVYLRNALQRGDTTVAIVQPLPGQIDSLTDSAEKLAEAISGATIPVSGSVTIGP